MTYDYQCLKCSNVQEEMHGMNETPKIICSKCNSENMKKMVSMGSGIIFKGSGWMTNDLKFKNSMTKENEKAGEKSTAHRKPVKTLGDLHE